MYIHLYLVGVLHRHLKNLQMSFGTTLQGQITCKEGSLTLSKTSKFVSLFCLLWQLPVPFFSTNYKFKACSHAWVVELSSILVMELKQRCSSYQFSPFLTNFEVFLCPLTYSRINVLWASIRGSISRNLSVCNPVYISSSIIYG